MKLPKINIGIKEKRNFFNLSHDVSTTCDFGFCQPTIIQRLNPNSKVDLKTSSFVRLAPMPCPTFGRVRVKTDNVFVPLRDVMLNSQQFLSQASYKSSLYEGVPSKADFVRANKLFLTLINMCAVNWDSTSDYSKVFGDGSLSLFRQIFRIGFSTNEDLTTGTPKEWHDLQTDFESFGLSNTARRNYLNFIYSLCENEGDFYNGRVFASDSSVSVIDSPLFEYLGLGSAYDRGDFFSFTSYNYFLHCFLRPLETMAYIERAEDYEMGFSPYLQNVIKAQSGMSSSFRKFFDTVVTSENADFSFQWCPQFIPVINGWEQNEFVVNWREQTDLHQDTSIYWRMNFQLTPFGRKLFKIFNSCHFNFGINNYEVELNKLYAYYKAWFDLYNPARTLNWENTNCYRLLHMFYDYPSAIDNYLFNASALKPDVPWKDSIKDVFSSFLTDLILCNYYLEIDPFTVTTRMPSQFVNGSNNSTARISFGSLYENDARDPDSVNAVNVSSSGTGALGPNVSSGWLDSLSVKLLERLYTFVNKESVLASDVANILRTKYGIDVHQSYNLGSSDFMCQISDIMGTVNNSETALGEYAGKGVGSGDCSVKFETDDFGYFIQLVTVIPFGGYVQGNERPCLDRVDFYTPERDSLGYEPITVGEILARESIINNFSADRTFGFRPSYFWQKYKNNLNNGGFSFRSQRGSFLPYALDRIFSEGSYNDYSVTRSSPQYGTVTYGNYRVNKPLDLRPVEELRSIGLYETFGNYDRIFYDTSGASDNFILHQVHDFKYYASMKPIQDSFDTVNNEVDDDVTKVDHN